MKYILSLDTSDQKKAVVKLYDGLELISEKCEVRGLASQVLLLLIEQICSENDILMKDISEIKVNVGPGSYTGLKVGAAIANAIAFYFKIPVNGKIDKPVMPIFE